MSSRRPKILIIGTGDLRNYGCEAIVQGTYAMFEQEWPGAEIYLASNNPEYDRKYISKNVKPVKYLQRFTLKRIYKGILRRIFKIGNGSEVRMNIKIGKNYDIVLSAGGDNYCQTPDKGIYSLLCDLMLVGDYSVRHGKKYVLWGASVGPFDREDIKRLVMSNLSKANLINVREERAYDYLHKEGKGKFNLHLVGDPAFYMDSEPYEISNPDNKLLIGVNMSALALRHCGVDEKNGIEEMVKQLMLLSHRHPDWKFVGIPHVEQEDGVQDDFIVLDAIANKIGDKNIFESLPRGLGARKTKGAIGNLTLLMAARMHCCVGGVSQCVPTLFVTYSPKGVGMARYAYGDDKFTLDCNAIGSGEFVNLVESMMVDEKEIREKLEAKIPLFKEDALKGVKLLKNMWISK